MVADLPDVVPEQLGGGYTSSRSSRSFDVFEGWRDNLSVPFCSKRVFFTLNTVCQIVCKQGTLYQKQRLTHLIYPAFREGFRG